MKTLESLKNILKYIEDKKLVDLDSIEKDILEKEDIKNIVITINFRKDIKIEYNYESIGTLSEYFQQHKGIKL